jgi:thioredoxin reductase
MARASAKAAVGERPFPPGEYPVVVVGSGPGAIQFSHELDRLGIAHATLSADASPGGMFRRLPIYQRLLSWTKPYALGDPVGRAGEWYDWNSIVSDDPSLRSIMPTLMDGSSSFPSRANMEENLATFVTRASLQIRYNCPWQSTGRAADGRFILGTPDGEYTCETAVFAVGMAEPWRPPTPGLELVPHYVEAGPAESYAGKRVFIVGKQNSAFEIATAFLPWARQLVLGSPRPAVLSVVEHSLAGVRARYVQPYEDAMLHNGVFLLDVKIDRIERSGEGFQVRLSRTDDGRELVYEADEVIATTGFAVPLRDLPALGVATFAQGKMPALTPLWESAGVPGIYFAGTITQAAAGLKKHGIPANSGALHGYRYNARVLARHLAATRFGIEVPRPRLEPDGVAPFLLGQLTLAPELWNQRSYLAQVASVSDEGWRDDGIWPLADFVDADGTDAVAVTLEPNPDSSIYPVAYVRAAGVVEEHLLDPDAMNEYRGSPHREQLTSILAPLMRPTSARLRR